MMAPRLDLDTADLQRIERMFTALPYKMQRIAFGRAAARTKQVVERTYARFASQHIRVPQRIIKRAMRSRLEEGFVTLTVKDRNIALKELNPRQSARGITITGRDMYRNLEGDGMAKFFIAPSNAKSIAGHVMRRDKNAGRTPVRMMFGPSAAHAARENPKLYEELLAEIARNQFAHVILQQVTYLMGRTAA